MKCHNFLSESRDQLPLKSIDSSKIEQRNAIELLMVEALFKTFSGHLRKYLICRSNCDETWTISQMEKFEASWFASMFPHLLV